MLHRLTVLAAAAAFALPAVTPTAAAAQDKPVTVKQVAKNVGNETKRVSRRTAKTVKKGYKDTEKQTRRTGRHLHRSVSAEERERQAAEKPR